MVVVNGDMVPPLGGAQDPVKAQASQPWYIRQPTLIGEGLTAPFTLGFVPGGHGVPLAGRRSITVDDETWLRPNSECTKVINVHLCINAEYAKKACGDKAQDAINQSVATMERGVQRYLSSVSCPCPDPDTYHPGECTRRVRIIWHTKCGDAGGGVTPLPLNLRCSSEPGQPYGLTTPDQKIDIEAPKGSFAEAIEEVYAHEIMHNLLGVPPPGGADQWDGQGHNVNDPEAGSFHPLMAPGRRTGNGQVSRKEACLLVSLTGGCDHKLCCRPIFASVQTSEVNRVVSVPLHNQGRD